MPELSGLLAAQQPDSRLEDLQPLARHVRGCRGGQLRRTHRTEDLPCRDRHRQGEARRGDGFVRSDPGNILVPRCRRRGSYGGDHPTQLYADQGGRHADHKTGTQTHRRRPCAAASVGEEVGGSTSPPIFVCHSLPSVLKSGNEECDFTLWTVCKENVRFLFFNKLIINSLRKFCHCYFILFFRKDSLSLFKAHLPVYEPNSIHILILT